MSRIQVLTSFCFRKQRCRLCGRTVSQHHSEPMGWATENQRVTQDKARVKIRLNTLRTRQQSPSTIRTRQEAVLCSNAGFSLACRLDTVKAWSTKGSLKQ